MTFLYRTEDIKLINSVTPLPYIKHGYDIDNTRMADIFFQSIRRNEILGLVEADKSTVVEQIRHFVNIRNSDEFEFARLRDWEKHFSNSYSENDWMRAQETHPFIDAVAKIFWLCDHLRNNGTIDFPITQAWNRYYNTWEVVVGNARLAPLRLFYHKPTLQVIRFKTEFCQQDIQWVKTFDSLNSIEECFRHTAVLNYRAWGGSLIPGIHFYSYDKNKYTVDKLQYQNKLATYYKMNNGLKIDKEKSLHWNINNILDGINALV
jgi:hypothetical protein